jgi:hypothetical protein
MVTDTKTKIDYNKKLKIYLIDNSLKFPEFDMCEQLLGNFGIIKEVEDVYINGIRQYFFDNTDENNYEFGVCHEIHNTLSDTFDLDYTELQNLIILYIEYKYNILMKRIILYNPTNIKYKYVNFFDKFEE